MVPWQSQNLFKRTGSINEVNTRACVHTLVVSGIPPRTTRTASGSRCFSTSSASKALYAGVSSEGFSTAALPAAIAPAYKENYAKAMSTAENGAVCRNRRTNGPIESQTG